MIGRKYKLVAYDAPIHFYNGSIVVDSVNAQTAGIVSVRNWHVDDNCTIRFKCCSIGKYVDLIQFEVCTDIGKRGLSRMIRCAGCYRFDMKNGASGQDPVLRDDLYSR